MTLDGAGKLVPFSGGKRGDILLAFITGEGSVSPVVYTGRTPTTGVIANFPAPAAPISITVGGVPADIQFAGIPRGLVGVTQNQLHHSAYCPTGESTRRSHSRRSPKRPSDTDCTVGQKSACAALLQSGQYESAVPVTPSYTSIEIHGGSARNPIVSLIGGAKDLRPIPVP